MTPLAPQDTAPLPDSGRAAPPSPEGPGPSTGHILLRTALGVLAGLLVLAGLVWFGGAEKVLAALRSVRPLPLLTAGGLTLTNLALKFTKWHLYLTALGARLAPWRSALVFSSGLSMVLTPGRAGELVKCTLLRRQAGTPVAASLPVLLAERVTEGVALVALALVPILAGPTRRAFPYALSWILAFTLIITAGVVALSGPWASRLASALAGRWARLRPLEAAAQRFCSSVRSLLSPALLLPAAGLSVAAWGAQCLALQALALSLGHPLGAGLAVLVLSLASMAGTASFLPAGLGAADASLAYLLVRTGATPSQGAAAVLLSRLFTVWVPLLLGTVALVVVLTLKGQRHPSRSG
ncbi:MAG: flippase-like domain-containing protein [Acetobacteraceae bacterium]|nr:flippase-like domain-containing protein [Acetobacteraceae bacterium]